MKKINSKNDNIAFLSALLKIADAIRGNNFLSLTDTPPTFAGNALRYVRVNSSESALEFDALTKEDVGLTYVIFDLVNLNTFVGHETGLYCVAQNNTYVGYRAGFCAVAGTNVADHNVAVGCKSFMQNATGKQNVAVGSETLYVNTQGNYNISIGYRSLYSNTIGEYNIAIGNLALYSNISATGNIAIGGGALYTTTGNYNVAVGYNALYNNAGGTYNVASGAFCLASNSSGANNVAYGYWAMYASTTGIKNTAIGDSSLSKLVGTYSDNVAVGYNAGRFHADGVLFLTTPSQSVYIGSGAMGYNNSDVNSIVIGYLAKGIGANTVVLGNDSIISTLLKGNVGIGITPTAKLDVNSDILRLRTAKTPATAGAAGNQGDICWDTSFVYICTALNTWKKAAIATW